MATSHETGATCEYQGQIVSLEWQSKQDRFSRVITSGGAWIGAVTGGLV